MYQISGERTLVYNIIEKIRNRRRITMKNRKDTIKNIAIVFLAILLLLTFFSNTIMNRSLV